LGGVHSALVLWLYYLVEELLYLTLIQPSVSSLYLMELAWNAVCFRVDLSKSIEQTVFLYVQATLTDESSYG